MAYTAPTQSSQASAEEELVKLRLSPEDTAIVVIDWQERLVAAMPPAVAEHNAHNVTHLLTLAARLDLPVLATEQYPRGLGPTVDTIAGLLPTPALAKTAFSAWRDPAFAEQLRAAERRRLVVVGMETHVCVFQTVRDLVEAGFAVQVPADAVVSRTQANYRAGLALCRAAGAVVTTTEAALFDLLQVGQGEVFKEISRRIR
ncbi:MAG: isochorismatase family protein [Myxococcales bacterium]|nr:isochorismatase family protein [Myxococcales bacterium]